MLRSRRTLWAVALAASSVTGIAAGANERVYHFVDESGVSHYSNVPMDPRYTAIGTEGPRLPATPPGAGVPEDPTHVEDAPPSMDPSPPEEEYNSSDR